MLQQVSPPQLKSFTRHLVHAAARRQGKQRKIQEIHVQVEKIKRFAANDRIRKETVKREIDTLTEQLDAILNREVELKVGEEQITKLEEKELFALEETRKRLAELEQRLVFFDERHADDSLVFMEKLGNVELALRQIAKKLKVKVLTSEELQRKEKKLQHELREIELAMLAEQLKGLEEQYTKLRRKKTYSREKLELIKHRMNRIKEKLQAAKKK
ncbi:hypothetical protein HYS48_03785 [Candidatus Woesearchaeota archaeon]|nr:hypothetical protein [Candidatus Woesearchaeota archaeon]